MTRKRWELFLLQILRFNWCPCSLTSFILAPFCKQKENNTSHMLNNLALLNMDVHTTVHTQTHMDRWSFLKCHNSLCSWMTLVFFFIWFPKHEPQTHCILKPKGLKLQHCNWSVYSTTASLYSYLSVTSSWVSNLYKQSLGIPCPMSLGFICFSLSC